MTQFQKRMLFFRLLQDSPPYEGNEGFRVAKVSQNQWEQATNTDITLIAHRKKYSIMRSNPSKPEKFLYFMVITNSALRNCS